MASKNLTVNLKKDTRNIAPSTKGDPEEIQTAAVRTNDLPTTKKKTGRPKTKQGEYKTINISVPVPVLEQMEVAKLKYGNNLTAYVNAIIKADLEANYDNYLHLQKLINS